MMPLRYIIASTVAAAAFLNATLAYAQPLAEQLAKEGTAALAAAATASGDPARGAVVFHTAHLTCTKCHVAGEGTSPLGPDLAGPRIGPNGPDGAIGPLTGQKLTEHLIESLLEPSKSIRPEYRAVTILTDEGQSVSGIVARESADTVVLRDATAAGKELEIARDDIDERMELPTSLMPAGLVNLLADRRQFLDLVRYLDEIARGGADRAAALRPAGDLLASAGPAAYESTIDHAGFIADWNDAGKAGEAFKRGEKIYSRVCVNCHGTLSAPGSLPTALRFGEGKFKAGADPHAMYRTLTTGAGQMVAQSWMVPSQKYDVIHYIREAYLKNSNPSSYLPVTPEYLAALPKGTSRGPEPSNIEPWRIHDYGPFLAASIEVGDDGTNVARKGLAVRLDAGPGGIGRGRFWILYELDTLRAAAIWNGDSFIDWRGINFDGSHGTHPHVAGRVIAATPTLPGWADPETGSFVDPRPLGRDQKPYGPLPADHTRFKALHHAGDSVILDYAVGGTRILETARLEPRDEKAVGGSNPIVTRIWSIAPHDRELAVRIAAVGADREKTAAAIVGRPSATARLEQRDGFHTLLLPPASAPLTVGVSIAAGDQAALAADAERLVVPEDLTSLLGVPAKNPWTTAVETRVVTGADTGPFATDVLTPPSANPWNAQVRFSGVDFLPNGSAALCTWDGDVWIVGGIAAADGKLVWQRIASGLYQPLGLKVVDGAIHVGCRDRIVVLRDIDGDGCTDRYDSFNSDHQVTEHFHEFAMGLERDADGNFYYAKSARHALPAVVPHHGTLLKVSKDGSATEILATGFRAANGVCIEPDGTFFVTDQEGHWNPKNRINHVRRGGFYGNMFGYHDVTDASDAAMESPLAWITNAFDRSPAELLRVPTAAWQPLSGKLLELSYGEGRIHLVLPQPFGATEQDEPRRLQGGLVQLPMPDLPTGIMRGRFHPADGQLYTCGLFAWAGNKTQPGGFFRVRRTQAALCMPIDLAAIDDGFVITFSERLDRLKAAEAGNWGYRSWRLERTAKYGSDHFDERGHDITGVEMSSDGRAVTVHIRDFKPTQCYELKWNVAAADGTTAAGRIHGTVAAPSHSPAAKPASADRPALWAAYYAWYSTPKGPRGRWEQWADPASPTAAPKYLSAAEPLVGPYDSDDERVVRWHMRLAKAAGIDALLVSWWGDANVSGAAWRRTILPLAAEENISVAINCELAQFHDDRAGLVRDIVAVLRESMDSSAYLRSSGRPVVYCYQVPFSPKLTPAAFEEVRRQVEAEVGPVSWAFDTVVNRDNRLDIPDEWLQAPGIEYLGFYGTFSVKRDWKYEALASDYRRYASRAHAAGRKVFLPVHPGHDNSRARATDHFVIPRHDGETLRGYLRAAAEASADAVLLTSFNEWPETTVVEPSSSWPDPYLYLKILAEWKGLRFRAPAPPDGESNQP